jgi:hypothetical protein
VFTARYALSPYIKQIRSVFKGLIKEDCTFTAYCIYCEPYHCYNKQKLFLVQGNFDTFNSCTSRQQQAGIVVTLYTVSERRLVRISARTLMQLLADPSSRGVLPTAVCVWVWSSENKRRHLLWVRRSKDYGKTRNFMTVSVTRATQRTMTPERERKLE